MIKLKNLLNEAKVKRFWVFRKDVPKVNKLLYHYFDKNFKFDKMKKLGNGKEAGFYNVAGGYDKIMRVLDRLDSANIHWVVPTGNESVNEAKKKQLTDADIKVGDAYKNMSARGFEVSIVYGKAHYGGWQTLDYQFEPQYGASGFMGVGSGPPESVDGWGKDKKIKITSKMKKAMIKTLQDAMKSKYKNSEEVDTLVRNGLRLSNVLSWVKARL